MLNEEDELYPEWYTPHHNLAMAVLGQVVDDIEVRIRYVETRKKKHERIRDKHRSYCFEAYYWATRPSDERCFWCAAADVEEDVFEQSVKSRYKKFIERRYQLLQRTADRKEKREKDKKDK